MLTVYNEYVSENEILLIDKPAGWTSFDVVAKTRGRRKAQFKAAGVTATKRQLRVGHAGTLDPFATGLLVLLLGDATKRADEFLKLDKTYEATVTLGRTSTTGDPEGEITEVSERRPTREEITTVLADLTGEIIQTPPAYSAIKINGQRAYKLARKGQVVEIPKRTVTIYRLELLDYAYPELKIRAHVGSGTYIRTLAEDIGSALGVGGYCSQLRRTEVGKWRIEDARPIQSD
jgi:tRNA pseudouridine55 synthase